MAQMVLRWPVNRKWKGPKWKGDQSAPPMAKAKKPEPKSAELARIRSEQKEQQP